MQIRWLWAKQTQACEIRKELGVSEADEAAVWRKGCERASVSLTPKGLTAKQ